MIRLRGHMICTSAEEVALVTTHLPEHTRLTRLESGCTGFEVTPTDDPMVFEVMETFRTRADFDAHQVRMRESEWFKHTHPIARAYRVEEIGD